MIPEFALMFWPQLYAVWPENTDSNLLSNMLIADFAGPANYGGRWGLFSLFVPSVLSLALCCLASWEIWCFSLREHQRTRNLRPTALSSEIV